MAGVVGDGPCVVGHCGRNWRSSCNLRRRGSCRRWKEGESSGRRGPPPTPPQHPQAACGVRPIPAELGENPGVRAVSSSPPRSLQGLKEGTRVWIFCIGVPFVPDVLDSTSVTSIPSTGRGSRHPGSALSVPVGHDCTVCTARPARARGSHSSARTRS